MTVGHETFLQLLKKKTCNGIFDEGHIRAIFEKVVTLQVFSPWLTTPKLRPLTDIWAECWRLKNELQWNISDIARVKNIGSKVVERRSRWHERLGEKIKAVVVDGYLDEGHILELDGGKVDVDHFSSWLPTSQAQIELTNQLLDKHRGSSAGNGCPPAYISLQAWGTIGTVFKEDSTSLLEGVVPKFGTVVPKIFTEYLLRGIIQLPPEQQLELVADLVAGIR